MEEPVRMEESDGLAHVEKVANESGQRHVGGLALTITLQPPDIRGLDVRLREERLAILACAQVVKGNQVGVAKPGPNLGPLKKPLIVIRAVGKIDNDFPPQDPVEGEPTAMWPIEPQLIAQVVPLFKWNGAIELHEAPLPSAKNPVSLLAS
jgi:hypothetical protein